MTWADKRASGDVAQRAFAFFMDKGLPPHQAAAMAANFAWESGGNVADVTVNDNPRGSPSAPHSVGLGQWNDRSRNLFDFARSQGIAMPSGDLRDPAVARASIAAVPLGTQLDFAWREMQGPERRAFAGLTAAGDVGSANAAAIGYHRPAGWTRSAPQNGHGFAQRGEIANAVLARGDPANGFDPGSIDPEGVAGMSGKTLLPPSPPTRAPSLPSSAPTTASAAPAPASSPVGEWTTVAEKAAPNGFDRDKVVAGLDGMSDALKQANRRPSAGLPNLSFGPGGASQWRPV